MSAIELAPAEIPVAPGAAAAWPFARRSLLAFGAVFFVLANRWFPLGDIPLLDKVTDWIGKLWDAMFVPVAAHLFHVTASTTPNGSGDTTYNYVLHAVCHLSEPTMKPLLTTRGFHWINEVPFNR